MSITVMTFNIRYGDAEDGKHHWKHRKDLTLGTVTAHDPDLLGLQEPTPEQWAFFRNGLPGYTDFGVTRTEWKNADPPCMGGFFRTERFTKLADGRFWLSETPDVPGSIDWPNDWGTRAVGWAKLKDNEAGHEFIFAVTHFDTNGGAWLPSAKVLHAELEKVRGGLPLIVMGDFNCCAGSEAHAYLTQDAGFTDAWTQAGKDDEGVLTFNAFTTQARLTVDEPEQMKAWLDATTKPVEKFSHYIDHVTKHRNYRIDWILTKGALKSGAALVDYRNQDGLLPSDHYPVIAVLDWKD